MLLWITLLFTLCNSHSYLILIWRKGHQKASSSKWREITCNIGRMNEDQIGILIVYPAADSLLTEHAKCKSFTIEKYISNLLIRHIHFIEIEFGETIHCIVWVWCVVSVPGCVAAMVGVATADIPVVNVEMKKQKLWSKLK